MSTRGNVKRSSFLSTSAALVGTSFLGNFAAAKAGEVSNVSGSAKPSIVFCHGIWADGSCFNKVVPTLQAEGYEVICAQYGLDTNEADVAATIRTLNRVHS